MPLRECTPCFLPSGHVRECQVCVDVSACSIHSRLVRFQYLSYLRYLRYLTLVTFQASLASRVVRVTTFTFTSSPPTNLACPQAWKSCSRGQLWLESGAVFRRNLDGGEHLFQQVASLCPCLFVLHAADDSLGPCFFVPLTATYGKGLTI